MTLAKYFTAAFLIAVLPVTEAFAQSFPITGRSYGGRVRMGPGLEHRQITSTGLNTRIVLLQRAAFMDGYDWFLIQLPNGNQGYQWGGLICADTGIGGVLTTCGSPQDIELSGLAPPPTPSPTPETFVAYSCNEGIPLHVRYRREGADMVAYASHDSFPEVRLLQIPSGSGTQYEDGAYWLGEKGGTASINFDGIEDSCVRVN
ncbi:MAG: MliC family protein [Pseudomonadota bacterium]